MVMREWAACSWLGGGGGGGVVRACVVVLWFVSSRVMRERWRAVGWVVAAVVVLCLCVLWCCGLSVVTV